MNPRRVVLIVRVDARRRIRALVGNSRRLAVTIVAGALALLPLGMGVTAAFFLGQQVGSGELDLPVAVVRGVPGGATVLVAVVVAIRAVQTAAVPANADGLLVWAGHREVLVAVLALETFVPIGLFGLPAAAVAVAFGLGAGAPASVASVVVAALAIIVLGALVGLAIGFTVRIAVARSPTLARYRTAIAVLLFVAYFAAIASDESASALGPTVEAFAATPLGWFGDLALIGAPVDVSAANAAGALVLTAVAVPGLVHLADRLAAMLWYETPVEPDRSAEPSGMGGDSRYVPRPVACVARKQWLRAWRSPVRLLYVAYPAFFLIAPVSRAIRSGHVPSGLPAVVALYGAWATGAAFTLNVVGEESAVLPVTLTTPVSGREFVGGCCLAGVIIGLPVTAGLALATAPFAELAPAEVVVAVALAVVLPIGATGLAAGLGVLFPRTEPVRVTRGREAIVPSLFAFALYSVVLVAAATPAAIVQVAPLRRTVAGVLGIAPSGALLLGAAFTAAILGPAAAASFRYAAGTVDDYRLS